MPFTLSNQLSESGLVPATRKIRGCAAARRAQPGDDAVEVEAEHVGPEGVAAGHLVRFMRDAGLAEAFAELPLAR